MAHLHCHRQNPITIPIPNPNYKLYNSETVHIAQIQIPIPTEFRIGIRIGICLWQCNDHVITTHIWGIQKVMFSVVGPSGTGEVRAVPWCTEWPYHMIPCRRYMEPSPPPIFLQNSLYMTRKDTTPLYRLHLTQESPTPPLKCIMGNSLLWNASWEMSNPVSERRGRYASYC